MTLQNVKLTDIQYISNTAGSIYSNPSSTKTLIKGFIIYNDNTTSETVKIYNVPDSTGSLGTAGVSNKFAELVITTKDTVIINAPYPIYLTDTNDSIQAETTTASKVTILLLGDKIA